MSLIDRLQKGDTLHQEAAGVLKLYSQYGDYILSDDERALAFIEWQRANDPGRPLPPHGSGP